MKARWFTHKHPLQHLLNDPKPLRISDEICAEFFGTWVSERHIVSQDVVFVAVLILNGSQRLVRLLLAGFRVGELYIVQFCAFLYFFLFLG